MTKRDYAVMGIIAISELISLIWQNGIVNIISSSVVILTILTHLIINVIKKRG